MELRTLTVDNMPAINKLMAEAFRQGSRPAPDTPENAAPTLPRTGLGIFDGPRLVACTIIDALTLAWGETDVPMGGIGAVACTVDQRGRGHVGRLLGESLRTMRDAGQFLSGLYPFSFAFYRRFGWDWVGEQRQYSVPASELKAGPEGRFMMAYEGLDALDAVRPVYERFARRYTGMGLRQEVAPGDMVPHWWKRALDHRDSRTTYVQVYTDASTGAAEGYLTFRYPSGDGAGEVGELFANTPAAYRGLLSVLHYYAVQVEKITFSAPMDDPLPLHMMHQDLETKIKPLFMGRVVDVAAALTALRPEVGLSGRLVLQIADAQCEWNNQAFAVTLDAGQVTATFTQDAPGVSVDIQSLSQAYWGQPSLEHLRAAGRVCVTDESQYTLLARLLPPRICFLRDFF